MSFRVGYFPKNEVISGNLRRGISGSSMLMRFFTTLRFVLNDYGFHVLYKITELMGYTYILASKKDGVLYVGVTSDLEKRIEEHKNKIHKGFTSKYNIHTLVRYQEFQDIEEAILYEKKLKGRSRKKKINLIEIDNPKRRDLVNID